MSRYPTTCGLQQSCRIHETQRLKLYSEKTWAELTHEHALKPKLSDLCGGPAWMTLDEDTPRSWDVNIYYRGPQSNLIPFLHLISESLSFFSFLFFFFSIWLNGYLMNCFSGTDRQSTTCSKIANSVVASSTLLGDIGSSSSSEMRGFNLGLSYPKEAMWNINAFY